MMGRFLKTVAMIAGMLAGAVPAHAQQGATPMDCWAVLDQDFSRVGDTVLSASHPMTPTERRFFQAVQDYLEHYRKTQPTYYTFDVPMPGVSKESIISVKLGKNFSVLLNLKPNILPRDEARDDDPFYRALGDFVYDLMTTKFPRNPPRPECKTQPPTVFYVFNMKTREPNEFRTYEWRKQNNKLLPGETSRQPLRGGGSGVMMG